MNYWLMKSEPEVFSYADLEKAPQQTTFWDNIRNYQARNFLRDEIKVGDLVFFYHSNAQPSAIVGIAKVVQQASVDPSQFDKKSDYYDPKATQEKPIWYGVHIQAQKALQRPVSLEEIKKHLLLKNMMLVQRGRLSVSPVSVKEWETIVQLAGRSR